MIKNFKITCRFSNFFYESQWGESIPIKQLVQRMATEMQSYTQRGGVRPMGVSLLFCGWDHHMREF